MPDVEFRLLGPVEVCCDGRPVEIGGAQQRALLALLLIHANRAVHGERLVHELWEDPMSERAVKRLQVAITRLRKVLAVIPEPGDGEGRLRTVPGGYQLAASPDELDRDVFAAKVHAGRRELVGSHPAQAADTLRAALAMWRGPALADVAHCEFAQDEIARLEELRLQATESAIDGELATGGHTEVLSELERLITANPLREHLRARLILALYRSGRQADALAAYDAARRRLVDEIGIEPGSELQRLHALVLRQDASLEPVPPPVAPRGPSTPPPAARLPHLLNTVAATPFVGRADELCRLAELWTDARAHGRRALVLISGEPGIGKTRLAGEIAGRARDDGGLVLYGRCGEDVGPPYEPWRQALTQLLEQIDAATLERHVLRHGALLSPLAPALRAHAPAGERIDAESERYLVFAALLDLLVDVARARPVLLVLDDLHWAGRPSLQLLKYIQLTAPAIALLVIATHRDPRDARPEPGGGWRPLTELLGELRREPGVERMTLDGLEHDDIVELLAPAGTGERATHLRGETGGNPFYLTELVRQSAAGTAGAAPPTSIKEAIDGRVTRLGGDAAQLLRTAAVIGRDFELDLLAHVAGVTDEHALDVLEAAVIAALVVEDPDTAGRFAFAHALVSHSLVADLGPTRRCRVHERIAAALEARVLAGDETRVAEVARHWAAAGPGATAKARHYARRAGHEALAQLAPAGAVAWFEQALALCPGGDSAERRELLLDLGTAQCQAGNEGFRETLLEAADAALTADDTPRLIRAALCNSRGFFSSAGFVDEERVAVLEWALARTGDGTAARARLQALLGAELLWSGDHERRRDLSDAALAAARAPADPALLADVLILRITTTWWPETLDERLADTSELLALAGDPVQRFWAHTWRAVTATQAGDVAEADRCLAVSRELADRLQQPRLQFVLGTQESWRAQLAGRLEHAERLADGALALGSHAGEPDAVSLNIAQIMAIRWQEGRLGELADVLDQIAEGVPAVAVFAAMSALASLEAGRHDEARKLLAAHTRAGFTDVPPDPVQLGALCGWAQVAARLAQPDAAAVLLERLLPSSGQLVLDSLGTLGSVAHHAAPLAGVLGREEQADQLFGVALATHERVGAEALAVHTLIDWSAACTDRDRLSRARADAERLRLPVLEQRAGAMVS